MRRVTRSGENTGRSGQLPSVKPARSEEEPLGLQPEKQVCQVLPRFRFVQSSPHSGTANVNGEMETVHWVVKDRPFAIRIYELPSPANVTSTNMDKEGQEDSTLMSWQDVQVVTQLVFPKTYVPVKPTTAQAPLVVEHSVIPASTYNHRRSAAALGYGAGEPGKLLLQSGAGLDLSVRLLILSSHLHSDFCVHVQLYLPKHRLIGEWYSEAIKSVSKWDKVRHLQDNYHLLPPKPSSSTPPSIHKKPHSKAKVHSHSRKQATQKPVSASISKLDKLSGVAGNGIIDSSASDSDPVYATQDDLMTTGLANMENSPSPSSSSHSFESLAIPSSSPLHHTDNMDITYPPTESLDAAQTSSMDFDDDEDEISTHSSNKKGGNKKQKKASGEEVFAMLAKLEKMHAEMARLLPQLSSSGPMDDRNNGSKKRKATWEAEYPTEQEAADGAAQHLRRSRSSQTSSSTKKPKMVDFSDDAEHLLSPIPTNSTSQQQPPSNLSPEAQFAFNANAFLQQLDHAPLADVRQALKSLLLTRPHLATILQRLMSTPTAAIVKRTCSTSNNLISSSEGVGAPQLGQSMELMNWNSEVEPRYGLGSTSELEMTSPEANSFFMVGVVPQEDDESYLSSPSWSDTIDWDSPEWAVDNVTTPDTGDSCPTHLLTTSLAMPAAFTETPVGY